MMLKPPIFEAKIRKIFPLNILDNVLPKGSVVEEVGRAWCNKVIIS